MATRGEQTPTNSFDTGAPADPSAARFSAAGTARENAVYFVPLPAPDPIAGERQRVRLHVPTPGGETRGTTLVLGQALDGTAYTGLTAQTYGHVFVHARGDVERSAMHLQAHGEVLVQSDESDLYALAAADAVHGAGGAVYLAGASGVSLLAGRGPDPQNVAPAHNEPPVAHDRHAIALALDEAAAHWRAARGEAARAMEAPGGESGALARHLDTGGMGSDADARAAFGKVARSPGVPGGLALFGTGGVRVGTPGAAAVHAGGSLALGGAETAVFGGEVEIVAAESVRVSSAREARVCAGAGCELIAGGTLSLRARAGAVSLEGPRVEVGTHDPGTDGAEPTHEVSVQAQHAARVHTRGAGSANGIHLTAEGGGLFAHGDERVEVVSQRAVDVRVGRFVIEVREDTLRIGMSESAGDSPGKPLLEFKDNKLVLSVDACGTVGTDQEVGMGELSNGRLQKGVRYKKDDQSVKITGNKVNIL